jgi:uncharacterized protein (TIGR03067 family)
METAMYRHAATILACSFLLATTACADDATALEGTWEITEFEGQPATGTVWTFEGNTISVLIAEEGDAPIEGTFELDDSTDPKQLDIEFDGRPGTTLAIYELRDDDATLVIHVDDGAGQRPVDFEPAPGPEGGSDLFEFARQE